MELKGGYYWIKLNLLQEFQYPRITVEIVGKNFAYLKWLNLSFNAFKNPSNALKYKIIKKAKINVKYI